MKKIEKIPIWRLTGRFAWSQIPSLAISSLRDLQKFRAPARRKHSQDLRETYSCLQAGRVPKKNR